MTIINHQQAGGIRGRANHSRYQRHAPRRVKQNREAPHAANRGNKNKQNVKPYRNVRRLETVWAQTHHRGHKPRGERTHAHDAQEVRNTLQTGGEVELSEIQTAGDEREARNDKQNRANIRGIVTKRGRVDEANQTQRSNRDQRSHHHAHSHAQELIKMLAIHAAAHILTHARAHKRAEHVVGRAAEQKHEARARHSRAKRLHERTIQSRFTLDCVELRVRLADGYGLSALLRVFLTRRARVETVIAAVTALQRGLGMIHTLVT